MLYIHLFGHLRLFVDERPHPFAALPRTLPLWAYLLLNRAEPVPRDRLAYLLWPDVPERVARANLRRHLYDLGRTLPPAPPERPWLLRQAGTLHWNPQADFWLDVAEFERLSDSWDHLARAVTLYTDDLLPELYDDWIAFERERLRNLYLADLEQLVAQCRSRGDRSRAIAYAQRILNHDPLREDAVRELMRLRYESGDRAGALRVYRYFENRLREELNVSPMPETQALFAAVARNAPLSSLRPAVGRRFPTAPTFPHNLPAPLNAFIGRKRELADLHALLGDPASRVRLLTLSGPAGVGKTRLALEAAARFLDRQADTFPDGIFFVDLAPVAEAEHVISTIATVLGVKRDRSRPLWDSLVAFLRSRYILLLLDNLEHLIEAGPRLAELLAAAPNLRILATSRAVLRLYGEQEYPLAPLPLPELGASPALYELEDNPAVALFVARARERFPGFALTAENATAVAEICVRLDGLPLAIELAAGRIKVFSPGEMLRRLTSRLAFLTEAPCNLPPRHRTLRRAIAWSYRLLAEQEQILFASLGVFAGGCTLEAIEAVCGPLCTGKVTKALAALIDHSLVYQRRQGDERRFDMVSIIREFALDQLARRGMLDAVRRRHLTYYAALSRRARAHWNSDQQAAWMNRLQQELENLRAALTWSLAEGADAERIRWGAELALGLSQFWDVHCQFAEAQDRLSRVLAHRHALSPETQVTLLNMLGWSAQMQGQYRQAKAAYREGLDLATRLGEPSLIGMSLHSLGTIAGRQGDYEEAARLLERAIALERQKEQGAGAKLAPLLNNLAIAVRRLGDLERAAALLEESLALKAEQGDVTGVAASLTNLGNIALDRGDWAQAEDFFRQSLQLRQEQGDRKGLLILLSGLAEAAMLRGANRRSVCLYSAAESLSRMLGYTFTPAVRQEHQRRIATLRERLAPADFEAAWSVGSALTLDQATAYARGNTDTLP